MLPHVATYSFLRTPHNPFLPIIPNHRGGFFRQKITEMFSKMLLPSKEGQENLPRGSLPWFLWGNVTGFLGAINGSFLRIQLGPRKRKSWGKLMALTNPRKKSTIFARFQSTCGVRCDYFVNISVFSGWARDPYAMWKKITSIETHQCLCSATPRMIKTNMCL